MRRSDKPGLLMTANWDSGVGYAWWLMESYWETLAKNYSRNFNCILAYPSISEIPESIARAPVQPVLADFSSFGVKVFRQIVFLIKNRIKVIYFSDKPARHWSYLLFRFAGVRKIVVHDHTPGLRNKPSGFKRVLKKTLLMMPGIKADVCIGATDFVKRRSIDVACMPENRCTAVPNGIPTDLPPIQSVHQRFEIPQGRRVIVTCARANQYKGGFFALEVLASLRRKGFDNWHYLYLGDGPDREKLISKSIELEIEDFVSFPGRVKGVLSLLQTCSFAFHPSKGEVGYSLSILEYMLCGLPVLVSNNPSVCGATDSGNTGIIYREDDVSDAVQKMSLLLEKPDQIVSMGHRASEAVKERFSLKLSHQQLIRVFDEMVFLSMDDVRQNTKESV